LKKNKHIALRIFNLLLIINFIHLINAQDYNVQNLDLGKLRENVYAPFLRNGVLYFASDVKSNAFKSVKNQNGSNFFDIYFVPIEKADLKGKPKRLNNVINTTLNDGPLTFNIKDSSIYYTRSLNLNDDFSSLGIYKSTLSNDTFSNPVPFIYNNINYNVGHPSINEAGDLLVFASDMPEGKGKSDLYFCTLNTNGLWNRPISVGDSVNSRFKESFPFLHKNQLYFCSDREGGYGGIDVYRSIYFKNKWTKPILLPEPINSPSNDFSIFLIDGIQEGYISTNRDGYSSDHILYFNVNHPRPDSYIEVEPNFCFEFKDEQFSDLKNVSFEWEFGDGTSLNGNNVNHCFDRLGSYNVSLHITDNYIDFTYKNLYVDTLEIKTDNLPYLDYKTVEGGLEFFVDFYSCDIPYDKHYWLVDGVVYYDDKLRFVNKVKELKYVTWSSTNPKNIIGIIKKL